ncbi:hypothetical protein EJ077_24615 [Mesorhizobium sp. M8A.F.Ca.ET.057.01.1.1]|nr:hypothetical protein EJ077_24615 [Mesorhizobium sp. M8A.F.Ca.ET.057.01.1.1]
MATDASNHLNTSGALTINDVDQGQSNFTAQASFAGTYGTFTLDASGNWTYSADDAQTAIQQLGAGQSITDSFTAVSSDGTASQLVTVTIHGTNDVPVIGGVSTGSVTEDVATDASNHLNTSGALTINDVDQGQSNFTAQASFAGTYGTFTLDASGNWTYSADDAQTAIQQLGAGQSITDSFTAVSSDGTASQLVTVTIHGTNDVPVIGGVSTGSVTEDVATDASNHLNTSGALTINDVDQGQSNFTAQASFAGTYGTFTLDASGNWTYSADDAQTAIQQLGAGQSITDSFTAVSSDGTASQLVTVTIHGTNDVPVIGGVSTGSVTEDVATDASNHLNTSGALTINDVDQGQSNFTAQASFAGTYGTFTLDASGNWTYSADDAQTAIQQLGAGQSITDSFTAVSSDGTASQLVTVTIHGTNDVPVIGGVSTGSVTEDVATDASNHLNTSGALTINDVDQGQSNFTAQASFAGTYGTFTLDASGNWTYSADDAQTAIQQLGAGQSITDSFTAVSSDGTASQLVTVTIHGTNDVPVIGGVSTGSVTEDVATDASNHLNTSGALTINDVDQGQSNFTAQASFAGTYGTFTLDAAGNWTYSADDAQTAIQQLGAGQSITDSFTAVSSDGTASQLVTVTIHGTNDVPVIGGVSTGSVTEDVATDASNHLNTSGALTINDVDQGQSNFTAQASFAGTYGTFTLDAAGNWTYSADNAQTAIQQLGAGQSITDSFTAVSSDGTASQLVTVTIHGTNDVPVIGGVSTGSVTEDVATDASNHLNTSGALTINDVDQGQSNFTAQASFAGTYGTFTLDASGNWTYSADDAQTAIQQLGAGQSITDSFTAVSSDGTASQLVTVTIHGTNDVPVIGGVSTGSVTEDVATDASNHLNTSGALTINDVDQGQSNFTAQASFAGTYGTFTLDAAGNWTYSADDAQTAIQQLGAGQSITDSFTAVSSDGTASQLVTVTIHGTNDVPVGVNDTSASLGAVAATEKGGSLNASGGNNGTGNVLTNDTDVDSAGLTVSGIRTGGVEGAGTASSVGAGLVGAHGTLTLNSNGSYTYVVNENDATVQALNTGGSTTDTFNYTVSDGSLTDTAVLTVTINGANDAPVGVNDTSASLGAVAATEKGGTLNASGGNNGTGNVLTNDTEVDSAGLTVSGIRTGGVEGAGTAGSVGAGLVGAHGTLTFNSNGSYTYVVNENDATVQALNTGGSTTDTFNYTVSDGSLTDTAVLTVTINGANDAAVLSSASVNLTEANTAAAISTSGTLTISDVDSSATFVAQVGTAGSYGTFAINAAGAWTYTASSAHDEFVAGQHYTETFNVVSADGTPTTVHIDILGTSDNGAPVAVADTNWVKEDTNTSATGNVLQTLVHAGAPSGGFSDHADTDPDADTLAVSALTGGTDNGTTFTRTGTYGSLVVTKATGAYTYTLANGQANVQALAAGQTVTDSFTYTVSDGHGGTASANLDVTVFGTDEVTPGLITLVADGKQGSNAEPSTVTITFTTAVNANFANLSNVMHVSGLPNVSVIAGSGSFNAAHTQYTFQVDKGAGSSNGSSYTLNIDAGAFSDTTGHTNAAVSQGSLKPAGTSGEPINLALTDPSHEGALITVTVKDVPSGWTIDGATHNADGSWTVQTNDLHGLTVTTPADCTGAAVLDVQMTWINADGTLGSASIADNVEAYAPGSPIFAWSGDDVLTGSHGNDLFVFSQPIGADTVHNFDAAADQIDLIGYSGLADFADLQTHIADDANGNAVIALGDGQSITLDGVHSGALTASNFVFDQTPVVNNSGTMTIGDGALLPLSGIINNSGLISLDSTGSDTLLQVIQHGVTLQGGGQILLSDSAANMISGTGPDVTLVNVDNTISGAGQLGGGMLSLDNRGTIIASGSNALVIDTGGSVVTNSGTLEATGSGGLTVAGGLANSGMLWANGGDIVIHGQVTGDGDATIGNLSKLEFGGASSTDVTFGHDAAGTLQLDDSFDYSGRIGGITNDDRLDLGDILFGAGTTAVYQANQDGSGGTLTVSDGTYGAALHLVGSYDANAFKLADDGQGHTVVSYNPAEFTLTGIGSGAISSDLVV